MCFHRKNVDEGESVVLKGVSKKLTALLRIGLVLLNSHEDLTKELLSQKVLFILNAL